MSENTVRGNRKERVGVVVSDVQDKTIVVKVERRTAHPLYRKVVKVSKNFAVHDEKNEAHKGDRVQIAQTAPISKTKAYTLVKVIEKARGTVELKEDVNKDDAVKLIASVLEPRVGVIPGLTKMDIRRTYQGGMDYALYSEFDSKESLTNYANHPAHLAAKEHFWHFLDKRIAADYEV